MKPQDLFFLVTIVGIFWTKKPIFLVYAALGCLLVSMPLFATWTFFTAERLTWYAAGFLASFLLLTFAPFASK